ncbi:hypothetical protein ACLGBR_02945 [Helicobacter pylori]
MWRGIGQIFQYEYFFENHLSLKNYAFCQNFNSVLVFPESVLKNNDFNVGLFKYPKSKKILEINSHNLAVRCINDGELEKLRETKHRDFKVISPYYVRDIRFFEVYFLLQVLAIFKFKNKLAHRKNIEETILKIYEELGYRVKFKPPKQKSQTSLVFGMNATNL